MRIVQSIFIIIGFVFVVLGVLGVFLPILPTTPFLLAALFCFTKGSQRVQRWFMATELYKKHVKEFNETRSMTLKNKILILAFASIMLLAGFYFSKSLHARIMIVLVICVKYYVFLFRIKTIKQKK
ncbi:MAG: YbaN family protein [Treponema sp.]